jgi:hypothetical protein
MSNIWETWASDQAVDAFLADVDALVAEGAFPDRRAAFVAYAFHVLSQLGRARWGPDFAEDGLSAVQLGDRLLAHAEAAERRGRARRRQGSTCDRGASAGRIPEPSSGPRSRAARNHPRR